MEHELFTPEQLEKLRDFRTPPPPKRNTRRKGSLRVANMCNFLQSLGTSSVGTWDIESRLRAIGGWNDLWPDVSPEGASKLLGDLLGAHGLKLASTAGKRGSPKRYFLPPGGIDAAYCQREGVELVDHPDGPISNPRVLEQAAQAASDMATSCDAAAS